MKFIISDQKNESVEVRVTSSNWRPTVKLMRLAGTIDESRMQVLTQHAAGEVNENEARQFGDYLKGSILKMMMPGERLRSDLTIASRKEVRQMNGDLKNLAEYEWLTEFAEFCTNSNGFRVY